jgi:hypothetical protein
MSFLGLEGCHVFITGAAGGIGRQAVKEFLGQSFFAIINPRKTRFPTIRKWDSSLDYLLSRSRMFPSIFMSNVQERASLVKFERLYTLAALLFEGLGLLDWEAIRSRLFVNRKALRIPQYLLEKYLNPERQVPAVSRKLID